jgi:lysophospholipase L1-like esterase
VACRRGFRVAVLGVVFMAGCRSRCPIPDADGDGTIRIACLGDSRTDAHFDPNIPRWCELLPIARPTQQCGSKTLPLVTKNVAVSAVQVTVVAFRQEALALSVPPADALVVAFGINDVSNGRIVEELIVVYKAMVAKSQGRPVFIATTPPAYVGLLDAEKVEKLNAVIERLNAVIRSTFPPSRVIDFDTGFSRDLYTFDGVHGNDAMEALMAKHVVAALD